MSKGHAATGAAQAPKYDATTKSFVEVNDAFDSLLDPCSNEMAVWNLCVNDLNDRSQHGQAACAPQMTALRECTERRHARLARIRDFNGGECSTLDEAYRQCMQTNGAAPERCLGNFKSFFHCAVSALKA